MTRIATSVLADDFDVLARRALAAARDADALELRLDRLPDVDERALAALIERLARPVIVAVHGPDAYGSFGGSDAQRLAILARAARAGASYVDVDWRLARAAPEFAGRAARIVSRHERRPSRPALELAREARAAALPGETLKLVVEAGDAHAALEVLTVPEELGDGAGDTIAFAAGEAGRFTRLLAPLFGSPIVYAAADPEPGEAPAPTAPGQWTARELRAAWPARGPSPRTAICAVLGRPIAQALSPRVHTRALRDAGVDAVFAAIETDDLARTLAFARSPRWRGFAVTAPLKEAAFELAAERDAASLRARACNTLVRTGAGWSGANTDVAGVERALAAAALRESPAGACRGRRALVLGAGGAARAALVALERLGARATVAARDDARAAALAREFGVAALAWEARDAAEPFDVVVHCTPAVVPSLAERSLRPGALVLDAVYRPAPTPLLAQAARAGAQAIPGAAWFAEQAARQFELFHGRPAPAGSIEDEVFRALA